MFMFIRERLCMQEVASVPFNAPAARRERKGQGIEFLGESAKRLFLTLLVARSSCNFKLKFSFFSKLISSLSVQQEDCPLNSMMFVALEGAHQT